MARLHSSTKRILVTGGAGYIGSHMTLELLEAGEDVVAVRVSDRHRVLQALRRFAHVKSVYPFGAELHFADRRGGDAAELARNPGAILPAITMVFGSLFPAFLVVIGAPMIAGESLERSGEFALAVAPSRYSRAIAFCSLMSRTTSPGVATAPRSAGELMSTAFIRSS